MIYATRQDLAVRFGEEEIDKLAADPDGPEEDPKIEGALADASAEIDSVLAQVFALPLPAGDYPLLVSHCAALARSRLYDDVKPEEVMRRTASARKQLRELVEGARALIASDGTVVRPIASGAAQVVGSDPIFSRDQIEDF